MPPNRNMIRGIIGCLDVPQKRNCCCHPPTSRIQSLLALITHVVVQHPITYSALALSLSTHTHIYTRCSLHKFKIKGNASTLP